MSDYPNIIITNTEGEQVDAMQLPKALEEKAIRLVVRIFLVNTDGRLFLQQRSSEVMISPNTWDQSAAGHVDEEEHPERAAYRELYEELGVAEVTLEQIAELYLPEPQSNRYTYSHCYKGVYDGEIDCDSWEVEMGAWWSFDEIEDALVETPEQFTEGFQLLYPKLKNYLFPFA